MDLLASMDANLAEHAGHLHRHTPGMSVRDTPELYVADSGLADDTFNIVARASWPAAATTRTPASRDRRRDARARPPVHLVVGPASTPADLSARLAAAGWPETGREVAMAATLEPAPPPDTDLRVRVAGSPAELADFAAVVAANWDPPAATVREFFAITAPAALDPGCVSRYLVGYDGDRPVAAAEVCLAAGVAGLFNVCTLVADRGRGHATALMRAALDVAVARGCRTAVLQASMQGERIYRRLGFRTVGEYAEHAVTGRLTAGSARHRSGGSRTPRRRTPAGGPRSRRAATRSRRCAPRVTAPATSPAPIPRRRARTATRVSRTNACEPAVPDHVDEATSASVVAPRAHPAEAVPPHLRAASPSRAPRGRSPPRAAR